MSYQIRHKEWGVFQGEFLGLGFWYPTSEQPEQGFCEFPDIRSTEKFIMLMCKNGNHPRSNFTIERYDKETSERLRNDRDTSPVAVQTRDKHTGQLPSDGEPDLS